MSVRLCVFVCMWWQEYLGGLVHPRAWARVQRRMHKVRNSPDGGHLLSMASARTQAGDQNCSKCFKGIMQGIGYKGLKGQRANRNEAS